MGVELETGGLNGGGAMVSKKDHESLVVIGIFKGETNKDTKGKDFPKSDRLERIYKWRITRRY